MAGLRGGNRIDHRRAARSAAAGRFCGPARSREAQIAAVLGAAHDGHDVIAGDRGPGPARQPLCAGQAGAAGCRARRRRTNSTSASARWPATSACPHGAISPKRRRGSMPLLHLAAAAARPRIAVAPVPEEGIGARSTTGCAARPPDSQRRRRFRPAARFRRSSASALAQAARSPRAHRAACRR